MFYKTFVIHSLTNSFFSSKPSRHLHSKTVWARDLKFWGNDHLPQCLMSLVTWYMSHVSCHMSHWLGSFCGGASHWRVCYQWDKQWKSRRSCLEKFALGRSQGKSVWLPEGPPVGKFLDNSWGFSTVSQTSGFKSQRVCVSQELSEYIPGFPQGSLTVLNPDFCFWIKKSGLSLGPV